MTDTNTICAASSPHIKTEQRHRNGAHNKTLEISCKIFTDDFEHTLRELYHTKVDFTLSGRARRFCFVRCLPVVSLKFKFVSVC